MEDRNVAVKESNSDSSDLSLLRNGNKPPNHGSRGGGAWGFKGKKFWDWMDLLLVPFLLFIATAYLSSQADTRQREANKEREKQEILQNYVGQITRIITEQETLHPTDHKMIRVYTHTAVRELNPERKGQLVMFLKDAGLIAKNENTSLLSRADLSGAYLNLKYRTNRLQDTNLSAAYLHGADLGYANLKNADLTHANLGYAKLLKADLTNANLTGADLTGADLTGAKLISENSEARKKNIENKNKDSFITLEGAILIGANLSEVDLKNANLMKANLSDAYICSSELNDANLSKAVLRNACLTDADLTGADLTGADLRDADLTGADLTGADLRDADLTGADLSDAELKGVNIGQAKRCRTTLPDKTKDNDNCTSNGTK